MTRTSLTYREQIALEITRAQHLKDPAMLAYYEDCWENDYAASVPWEFYKGSWAGLLWLERVSTKAKIEKLAKELGVSNA
jgi:hypothetical protein